MNRPAFCFFPTKEATNLNFIIHAPFLLTDSREGIKAGEPHNQKLIQELARLTADSLPILRDEKLIEDGILDIIPYDEARFSEQDDRRRISFKPFFTAVKERFRTGTLLPAVNKQYSPKSCSYWASDAELVGLFSDEQLAQLTSTKHARWIFRSIGKKEVLNAKKNALATISTAATLVHGIAKSRIVSSLAPEDVLKKITPDFITAQPRKWLHEFYGYLSERASYQKFVKDKPIFLDQDGNATSAFDGKEQLVLFLPDDDMDGYATVNKELLSKRPLGVH